MLLHQLLKRISLWTILGVLSGCVTTASNTNENGDRLVERSKEQAPAWIELEPRLLHETESFFKFVEVQTRLLDFSVGLNQTQQSALKSSAEKLRERVRQKVINYARQNSLPVSGPLPELDRAIDHSVSGKSSQLGLKVSDIYFERYAMDIAPDEGPREYFKAYVLIQFPKQKLTALLADMGRKLRRSGRSDVRQLGQIVDRLSREEITH